MMLFLSLTLNISFLEAFSLPQAVYFTAGSTLSTLAVLLETNKGKSASELHNLTNGNQLF